MSLPTIPVLSTLPTITPAELATLLAAIETNPVVSAAVATYLAKFEATIESKTSNVFLKGLEVEAFNLVNGYLRSHGLTV